MILLSRLKINQIELLIEELSKIKNKLSLNQGIERRELHQCIVSLQDILGEKEQSKISKVSASEELLKSILDLATKERSKNLDIEFDEHSFSPENISALKDSFRQSQKMEAIGRMAGGIAHDFNNFLTVILGYGRLILEELEPTTKHYNLLTTMVECAERAALLTQQLLTFSRRQVVETKTTNINSMIRNIHSLIKRILGEERELIINTASDLRTIEIDQSQLQQIIMNLVVNARDAMPVGGRLILETYNVNLRERVAGLDADEYSVLVVSDNGIGMSKEVKARVFEPFFTTKEIGKGTGLGLSTVYGIVKQAKGWIELTSEVNQGTTFKIYFPSLRSEYATIIPPMISQETLKGHGRILVVEDEDSVREVSAEILERAGYEVIALGNPEDAIKLIENSDEKIDLLLSDVIMPKMRGTELVQRLRCCRPHLKVLFMSGYTDDALSPENEFENNAAYFLPKPFTKIDLLGKVKTLLSEKSSNQYRFDGGS